MRRIILALTIAAMAAFGLVTSTTPAFAGTGNQWCDGLGTCFNAWNGGPSVKIYSYPAVNNDFTPQPDTNECNGGVTTSTCPGNGIPAGLEIDFLIFTGGVGQYNNTCMQDNGNNPSDAKAAIGGSCSGTGGWGANFVYLYQYSGVCQGTVIFYNIHWRGAISVNGPKGAQVYLNNANGSCFTAQPPA